MANSKELMDFFEERPKQTFTVRELRKCFSGDVSCVVNALVKIGYLEKIYADGSETGKGKKDICQYRFKKHMPDSKDHYPGHSTAVFDAWKGVAHP